MTVATGNLDRVVELLSQGLTTVEIRERMRLSNGAVQGYIRRIRDKLGAQAI